MMRLVDFLYVAIHSSEFWPPEHPLHNVNLLVMFVLVALIAAAYIQLVIIEQKIARWYREPTFSHERWDRLHRESKNQKRDLFPMCLLLVIILPTAVAYVVDWVLQLS